MRTWIGLILAVLGLVLGLGSTLLDDSLVRSTDYASFLGIPLVQLVKHSPTLVGLAILMMIGSFLLIFSKRNHDPRS